MKRVYILKVILILIVSSFIGCGNNTKESFDKTVALYSDPMRERTVAIDLDSMKLIEDIYSNGKNTYNVDILGGYNTYKKLNRYTAYNKVYAMTRGSNSLDVIDTKSMENIKTIELEHYPRSSSYNPILNLLLVSGKDKAMASIIDIDSDEVILVIGENKKANPKDYGGSNATGHPYWVSENQFLILDREKREIQLYKLSYDYDSWSATLQDKMKTSTSVHHVIREGISETDMDKLKDFDLRIANRSLYGVTEGSFDKKIAPTVIKFKVEKDKLLFEDKIDIGFDESIEKGIHHILFHPKQDILYIPSKEGVLYVADYKKMEVISTIKTGKGSGHIKFAPKRDLAVVTNHNDKFVTIIDTKNNVKIKDVVVSGDAINGELLQSHTQYIDRDENYFYAFATDNGKFYELSLDTLEVTRTLYTGGTPKQGGFIYK